MAGNYFPSSTKSNPGSFCEECSSNQWKYRCPGCSIRTCSLPCVQSHKRRSGCTGKRSRSEVVPLSRFDDNLLIDDYKFLEEAKRVVDSANRTLRDLRGTLGDKLPTRLWLLFNAARHRRTELLFVPPAMSKRLKNQSRFEVRKRTIFWTIEWRFHSTNVVLTDHYVNEHLSWISVITKHLKPCPWHHPLRQFCSFPPEDLKLLIRKNAKGTRSPFRELDIQGPICQQLSNILLIEYPVVHVYLPSHNYDFEVDKYIEPVLKPSPEISGSLQEALPSPKGIIFREEEIEEGEVSPDTEIIDLVQEALSKPSYDDPRPDKPNNFMDKNLEAFPGARIAETPRGSRSFEEENFNFEQELKDVYSELMAEVNPDDFLCFDGEPFILEEELLGLEELEEGEIMDK